MTTLLKVDPLKLREINGKLAEELIEFLDNRLGSRKSQEAESGLGLIGVLLIISALLLTAGGVVVWQEKAGPLPSPTPSVELKPTVGKPVTPTTAPTIITPFPGKRGEIQAIPSQTFYRKGEEVEIQVTNNSSQPISYLSGPGCGVSFERRVNTKWQSQYLCWRCFWASSEAPCLSKTIEPNTQIKITMPIENQAPSGIYRAIFHYLNGQVYSSKFEIL